MRLLEPRQIKEHKKFDVDQVAMKLAGEITQQEERLKKLKADYKVEHANNLREQELLISEISDMKSALLSEVSKLEERKRDALIPLTGLEETLRIKEKELIEKESILLSREKQAELTISGNRNKKKSLDEREHHISIIEYEIQERKQTIQKGEASLAERTRDFEQKKERENDKIERKKMELNEKETDISVREKELEIKNEQLIKEKTILNNERKHLESQQATLRSAYAEIKKHE